MSKRGAQGNGTIRQRPDGRWEARYVAGRNPGTGKQIRKSVYGDTQNEVRQKLNTIVHELDEGTYKEPSKLKLSEWLDIWQESYLGSLKASSLFSYQDIIRRRIKPALGEIKLEQLTTHAIQGFYNNLGKPQDDKKGLSPKTVKDIHGVLHKALSQAVAIGYIRSNPSSVCTLPRIERPKISTFSDEQLRAFLEEIEGHRHEMLYRLALFTGLRESEIMGLMWDCVDFFKGTILIDKQLQRERKKGGQYYFSSPKNGKSRKITPPHFIMQELKKHRLIQAESGVLWKGSGLVFCNEEGGYLSYRTAYDCFKRIVAKIGCPEMRFHDMRHPHVKPRLKILLSHNGINFFHIELLVTNILKDSATA
ncbi:site-specific integrase [Clostridiaceae bacterium OttesenSCG-928-D20]|nr:site-specific integrase [Clostridiaceae bacterium OttesenSCG-928-D20]